MMRVRTMSTIALASTIAALLVPIGARGADAPASPVSVTATRAVGTEAVTISGTAPAGAALEATLYARYSQDLPTVLLSRHAVWSGANGRYLATISIAPAFFRNAIVTVVIHTLGTGDAARASVTVGAPNVTAPPDDLPSSFR